MAELGATDAGFAPADAGEQVLDRSYADGGSPLLEAPVAPRVVVRIDGAQVLPAELYLEAISLAPTARADAQTAREVRDQVRAFLHRTGFELATVSAAPFEGGIAVDVDEGQVERIVFPGQLSYQLMRFKLALQLPGEVFNRSLLDRQVRELSRELTLPGVRWELVRTAEVPHLGPQIESLPAQMDLEIQGEPVVHARRPYEVRVYLPENTLGTSLGVDVRSGYTDGIEAGLNYLWRDLLWQGDLARVAGSGGVGLRSRLDTGRVYAHFSRAFTGLRYGSRPLVRGVRLELGAQAELLARQRADLALEDYQALSAEGSVRLEWEAWPGMRVLGGGGFQWRRLFAFQPAPGTELPPAVNTLDRKRPFLAVAHESVFDPTVLRWDRRHALESELREFFPFAGEPGFGWTELRYQWVKALGWHDLWLRSRGHLSWGELTFHDELSLGELARGLFGDQFIPSGVNLQVEFRFSLTRDLLKLSVFHDAVLYAVASRTDGTLEPRLANAFGPGAHFLLQDLFQLDMYVAFGFRRGAQLGTAFTLQLQKAF